MKEALLIIDVQNDYFPGGSNELFHPLEAEKRIEELIAETIPAEMVHKSFIAALDGVFATIV